MEFLEDVFRSIQKEELEIDARVEEIKKCFGDQWHKLIYLLNSVTSDSCTERDIVDHVVVKRITMHILSQCEKYQPF